jgi:hypothetical protein
MRPTKKLLEKFTTEDLKHVLHEFFTKGIYEDFYCEVMSTDNIASTDKFFRDFAIEHIIDEVSFEDLVESGWCYDDEMDDND